jgi:branched-chain amino acid transport system ATP-binding protein
LATPEPLLAIKGLAAYFGKVAAIQDLSLEICEGEVVALLGANGAGKTTLLNTISGFIKSYIGTIEMRGERISGLAPHKIFRKGVVQVSQTRDLFVEMSVLENLELGAAARKDDIREDLARIFTYFPGLDERRQQRVKTLSGGEQQMVAIGRALMGGPKILLLDEPSGGLAPRFVQEIAHIIAMLKKNGTTMLLVEQNIALAMSVADRIYILREGNVVWSGRIADMTTDLKELARKYYL